MKYRLLSGRPLDQTIPSLLSSQVVKAAETLRRQRNAPAAIHSARKDLKRVDALLFLTEPIALSKNVKHQRKKLKELARRLSAKRDADVLSDTIEILQKDYGKANNEHAFSELRSWLKHRSEQMHISSEQGDLESVSKGLRALQPHLAALKLQSASLAAIVMAAAATYRQGRAAMRQAFASKHEEVWHGWRRYVQRHSRHMALLSGIWADEIEARVTLSKQVAGLLGLHHDLAILRAVLQDEYSQQSHPERIRWFTDIIKKKQTKLEKQIIPLGRLLFAEKPKAFLERFRRYCAVED